MENYLSEMHQFESVDPVAKPIECNIPKCDNNISHTWVD